MATERHASNELPQSDHIIANQLFAEPFEGKIHQLG